MNLNDLNPMQKQAAEQLNGPVLILAGAGSGKTRTITYRIANLLEHGVSIYHILALTFTNKAAREMRRRIETLTGKSLDSTWIGTFHSICCRILRRDIEKLGYSRSFSIYDQDDQLRVIKAVLKELDIDEKFLPPKEVSAYISDMKNHVWNADEWLAHADKTYRTQRIHDVIVAYEAHLKAANALDFDDLLFKTLQLFIDHPPILSYYQQQFRYVHVDEYQDTNFAQYHIIRLLTQDSRNLCVVGDDDQSIYAWRGADIRNILNFEKDYPDAKVIKLEQNYRSTGNILAAANDIIKHNFGRKEKRLWTDSADGEKITLYSAEDERVEARWIANKIKAFSTSELGKTAVLYRIHAQSRVLEETFMTNGIPYRVFGGTRFYDRKEIRDIVAYLRFLENPADNFSLNRIINVPKRSIGDATIDQLSTYAADKGMSLYAAVLTPPSTLGAKAKKSLSAFSELMIGLMLQKDIMPLSKFVQKVIDDSGLLLQYANSDEEEDQTRVENIREFMGAVTEFEQKESIKTLAAFLESVSLITDLDAQEDAPAYVTLMTLHSAKGLEFDTVFMPGMEEGIFPSSRAMAEPEGL